MRSGVSVELVVDLPSPILDNSRSYSYRARFWSTNFLYVGTAVADEATLNVSAKLFDAGKYTLLVTRFDSHCTQCPRPSQFVHATNITVSSDYPEVRLYHLPSCNRFSGAAGRWARQAAVCPGGIGDDPGCFFPGVQSLHDKWLWLPFTCTYRIPPHGQRLRRNATILFMGDSTFRFLWGAFVSFFEDEEQYRFHQHGYGIMHSTRLRSLIGRDTSLRWQDNTEQPQQARTLLSVKSRCAWESNPFIWQKDGLRIAYTHPFWTCHNKVQCLVAKRCKIHPEENRRRFQLLIHNVAFDYAIGATADTASEAGCSSRNSTNAQLEAVAMLRDVRAEQVYMYRRSLIGFLPDNGARLHCVNAATAAHAHVEFVASTSAPLFNDSIDTFTMSNWLYHFSKADAAMLGAEATLPHFAGDGVHAGQDVNRVLGAMLAVHILTSS